MKYLIPVLMLPLFLCVACASFKTTAQDSEEFGQALQEIPSPAEFTLGAGDEIEFNVWQHDDLRRTLIVDPVGNIYIPLVGELPAAGLTLSGLRKSITPRLAEYIVNPNIDIHVTSFKSQSAHVLGEVKEPGTVPLGQKMFIWEAIAKSGGFSLDANRQRVLLIRTIDGESKPYIIDVQKILETGKFDQSLYLASGDVIYVAPSTIADVERFMVRVGNIINPFVTFERGIILWPSMIDVLEGKDAVGDIIISP